MKRFWSKVQVCKHGVECKKCCWLWKGAKTGKSKGKGGGYGCFYPIYGVKKNIGAHIVAYELYYGEIKDRKENRITVCHTCDTPSCCNYYHLFTGTQHDNVYDCIEKGRHAYAKFEMSRILRVFELRKEGMTHMAIERELGISHSHIGRILNKERYKHLH